MKLKGIVTVVYALFILAGGIIGFVAAHSTVSLVSGIVLGGLALVGGLMLLAGNPTGQTVAVIATLVLFFWIGAGLYAAMAGGRPATRAGIIFGLTLVELVVLFLRRGEGPRPREHGYRSYPDEPHEGEMP